MQSNIHCPNGDDLALLDAEDSERTAAKEERNSVENWEGPMKPVV